MRKNQERERKWYPSVIWCQGAFSLIKTRALFAWQRTAIICQYRVILNHYVNDFIVPNDVHESLSNWHTGVVGNYLWLMVTGWYFHWMHSFHYSFHLFPINLDRWRHKIRIDFGFWIFLLTQMSKTKFHLFPSNLSYLLWRWNDLFSFFISFWQGFLIMVDSNISWTWIVCDSVFISVIFQIR